jgi:hypothetical protein
MKIRSPKTNRMITINGPAYKNLIKKDNYTENQLLKIDNLQLPEEMMSEILYHADFNTIINYCKTKKYHSVCHSDEFWKFIFKRDNIPIKSDAWINDYQYYQQCLFEANLMLKLPYKYTSGLYDIVINPDDEKEYFNNYIVNEYGDIFNDRNYFYTGKVKNEYKIIFGIKHILLTDVEFMHLLADILYFHPNTEIVNMMGVLLRVKDKRDKTVNAKNISDFYKKYI